jgi:nucleotide-binding universal stress UspA family protein
MFERLVLAMDESPAGEVGLSFATALARAHRSTVHVVHVAVVLTGGGGGSGGRVGMAEPGPHSSRLVEEAVAQLAESGVDASGEELVAPYFLAGVRVARLADRVGACAIVLGSHRHRRVHRLVSHGMRERITRASSLPVLVAPAPLRVGRIHRRGVAADLRRASPSGPSGSRR